MMTVVGMANIPPMEMKIGVVIAVPDKGQKSAELLVQHTERE